MVTVIKIPDFDFSAFYYPEILEALIQYKRINVPELTDESEYEPFIQLLRAYALVGHLNSVTIDLVANESTLPTAKLVETVRNMLRLIAYELKPATPSGIDLVHELSRVFTDVREIIPEEAQSATKREGDNDPIYFEILSAMSTDPTDEFSYVLAEENDVFTDVTTEANIDNTPADDFTPWATPAAGDKLYFGHKTVMWDVIDVLLSTLAADITGVFEYYNQDWRQGAPTSVTLLGGQLEVNLASILGPNNRAGAVVRIQLNATTAYEDLVVAWDGLSNIITTVGLLGQTIASVDPNEYTVGSNWVEIPSLTDDTNHFTADGAVEYALPQTIESDWAKSEVDDKEAYWIRYRIITVGVPTAPVFNQVRMDTGKQYMLAVGIQGRTFSEPALGSSTGLPDQKFTTSKKYFLWDSEVVTVGVDEWVRVDNFLNSESGSQHYVIKLGEDDTATVVFGGGGRGKIPPVGVANIGIAYRYGANQDGNVGTRTVIVDKTGLSFVSKIWNPRQATGWAEAQGASEESLELAKIVGPASIRTSDVALGPDDVEALAIAYQDISGQSPFSRAKANEGGYGPKTVELILVAAGGGFASASQLEGVQTYFNGDKTTSPPKKKHIVANQEVVAVNYSPKIMDVTATIYGNIDKAVAETQLIQLLHPEAKKADGVTWEWDFGATVHKERVNHELFSLDNSITNVIISIPAGDTYMQARELPIAGAINITIIKPA